MRAKPVLAAIAIFAVLALIVRQVGRAVKHTFTPPAGLAQVDRSTPMTQNGLTLLEIQNVSPDRSYSYTDKGPQNNGGSANAAPEADTGLWIKMPPNFSLPTNCDDSSYLGCAGVLSATARVSSGQTIPLRWRKSNSSNSADPIILLVDIPAGYPNTVRWADVTLDDKRGDIATWRITHLPPMQHVLAPPIKAQTMFHQGGIVARAAAYRGSDPNRNLKGPVLLSDVSGTVKPSPHQWELGPMTLTREWEPMGYVPASSNGSYGTEKKNGVVRFEANGEPVNATQPQPYLADTHWVRLTAQMQEFETYDETVTFHNVSVVKYPGTGGRYLAPAQPQTVISPSGIPITLVDVQHEKNLTNSWGGDGVGLLIRYPQTRKFPTLPQSPFWRKYKRLVTVSIDFPKPYQAYGSSSGDTEGTYSFHRDGPIPKVIPNFPVIVRQSVDLQAIPMTFTLPVLDKQPKR